MKSALPSAAGESAGGSASAGAGRVLIVDDEKSIRTTLQEILARNGYETEIAADASEALRILGRGRFDVVLSDLILPGKTGVELAEAILARAPGVVIILMTGEPSFETATQGLRLGVMDYLSKPVPVSVLLLSIARAVKHKRLQDEAALLRETDRRYRERLEELVGERTRELALSLERLHRAMRETIQTMASVVETRDPYTSGHQQGVADLALAVSAALGDPPDLQEGIYLGGLIHDIGKIGIPSEILVKPGKLNPLEFELVKTHPKIGFDVLRHIEFPWQLADMVHQHHERLDGSGYPRGLEGDRILREARILAVADVVEAMSAHRPYRPALGLAAALEEIKRQRGRLYDAPAVDACVDLFENRGFRFQMAGDKSAS